MARFLEGLPRHGWNAVVLTQPCPPWLPRDETHLSVLGPPHRAVRVPSFYPLSMLLDSRRWVLARLRALLKRAQGGDGCTSGGDTSAALGRFERLWNWFAVPDYVANWQLTATPVGCLLGLRCQVVLASAPTWTPLLVAYDISRVTGRPLIVDMRDPWTIGGLATTGPPWRVRWDSRMEERIFRHAARVICNTDTAREAYARKYPDLATRLTVIPNGYTPWEVGPCPPHIHPSLFQLVHVGNVTSAARDPATLFAGVQRFLADCPAVGDHLKLTFIGALRADHLERAIGLGLGAYIEAAGPVPHKVALDCMSHAPVLLLLGEVGQGSKYTIQGKAYEYLAAQRPILGILPADGANADIIRRYNAGMVAEITRPEAVAEALAEAYRLWQRGLLPCGERAPTEFSLEILTGRLVSLLEEAARPLC